MNKEKEFRTGLHVKIDGEMHEIIIKYDYLESFKNEIINSLYRITQIQKGE